MCHERPSARCTISYHVNSTEWEVQNMSAAPIEVGKTIVANGFQTNYHDYGDGPPVVFIHGSGPGVSSWSNFSKVFPVVSKYARAIGFDLAGFGYTELKSGAQYGMDLWLDHLESFLDEMGLRQVAFVGNSAGGVVATHFAVRHPDRVSRMILMGANTIKYSITPALDFAWGYEPSIENITQIIQTFPYDKSIITKELIEARYQGTLRSDYQAAFRSMFPAPRQKIQDSWALSDEQLRKIDCEVLLLHGRDDEIIPVDVSIELSRLIPRAQLHVFGQCGHWVQVERPREFLNLLESFLKDNRQS